MKCRRCIPNIRYGEWAKDTLDAEFDYVINRDKANTPEKKCE